MSEDYELGTYGRDAQVLRVDQMSDGVPIEQHTRSVSRPVGAFRVS